MSENRFSRRYFFYGTLLAGAVPAAGFGTTPSLKVAGIQVAQRESSTWRRSVRARNPRRICDRHTPASKTWWRWRMWIGRAAPNPSSASPKAARYKDFRQMLDKHGKEIDAVVVGPPDHMHAICALPCMQLGKHVYVEKPLTPTSWESRVLTLAAEKYKVATQMGNQGYSHDATRVACEIFWSGEIGGGSRGSRLDRTVRAGLRRCPGFLRRRRCPTRSIGILWLGGAAARPFTGGRRRLQEVRRGSECK
jgi:hypothetical protein